MTAADLRTLLLERNLSQRQLAKLCGVDERTVRRWCDSRRGKLPAHVAAVVYYSLKTRLNGIEARP